MKKTILATLLLVASIISASAQDAATSVRIAYFSYSEVMQSMPAYATAMEAIDKLRAQYAEELQSAEDEFNEKYELFLDQQAVLADAIKQKRQADLQALLDRNIEFRKESERLLKQAEAEALAPVHAKIKAALQAIGKQNAYLMIVNTDSEACPYIDEARSEDITPLLIDNTKK